MHEANRARGAGLAGVAWTGAAAQRSGRISPVELGVLVFMALGVAGLLQDLPDAVSRLPVGRASLQRLAGLSRLPGPVLVPAEDGGSTERGMPPDPALGGSRHSTATVVLRGAALAYPELRQFLRSAASTRWIWVMPSTRQGGLTPTQASRPSAAVDRIPRLDRS